MSDNASEETSTIQSTTIAADPAQVDSTSLKPLTNGLTSEDHTSNGAAANGHVDVPNKAPHVPFKSTDVSQQSLPASHKSAITTSTLSREPAMDSGENITVRAAEPSTSARGRGRGGVGRARGKGRRFGKTSKRKRGDDEDDDQDDDDSEDSEVCAPTLVMTKSGRSVQRPTAFVPPPAPSPTSTPAVKKKRVWRRNPENAVCKVCLRGVSPASNMIVFCDGCNTPYHRWCHHPPIDQSVIDETDKEWYCRQCRRERIVPVPEADVAHFVAVGSAPVAERQKFFAGLTPGALVTLLTRITTLQPDLPVFDPEFAGKHGKGTASSVKQSPSVLGASTHAVSTNNTSQQPATIYVNHDDEDEDEGYGPEEHPAHYVRPGKGLMSTLPPDKDDEQHLVDEDSSKGVFHHIYLVDEEAAKSSVNGSA